MFQDGYRHGSHISIFSTTPLPASNHFWTKVQLSRKSDAFLWTNILLSPIIVFNLLYSISKIALPWYSRVSYRKLNGWEFGDWLTANLRFPAVTWKTIVWSFSMPMWCNKHLPGQNTSITDFEILVCLPSPQAFFWGEGKFCLFSNYSIIPFFGIPVIFYGQMTSIINQAHFVLNSLWLIVCHWWAGIFVNKFRYFG